MDAPALESVARSPLRSSEPFGVAACSSCEVSMSNGLTSGLSFSWKLRPDPSVPVPRVSSGLVSDAETLQLSSCSPPLSGAAAWTAGPSPAANGKRARRRLRRRRSRSV